MTTGDILTKRQKYERLRSALLLERYSFEPDWREIAQYIRPRRTRFFTTERNRGERRNQSIIDSTATYAARTLQSGMHAGLTSPAREWMRLTVTDPDLADWGPVKDWLHIVTQRMLALFQRSNVYNALPILYGDEGVFGTGAMAILNDPHDFLRCYTYPVGSYALGVSDRGTANSIVREWQMTVRQVVEQFGVTPGTREIDWTKLSARVKSLWDNSNYESSVEVTWVVTPNEYQDAGRLGMQHAPFASCHFEKGGDDGRFLRESGFYEFPVTACRWAVTGAEDIYATEYPGLDVLGDTKALQLMCKKKAQAVELMINPSLQAPTHVLNQKVSLLPGDISWLDVTAHGEGIRAIREVRLPVAELTADIQDTRQLILRGFYADIFLMLAESDRRQITAREIAERHEEKLIMLGPVTERNNDEVLDPFVDRVYNMMDRGGLIPEPPEQLQGQDLKVEYVGLLAQAQKLIGLASHDRLLSTIVGMTPVFPDARHKLDVMQYVDDLGSLLGVNPRLVVPTDQAIAAIQAERQAQAKAAQLQQEALAAKSARDLSQAPLDSDNALARMVGQ